MKAANQVTDHLTIEDTVIEEDLSDTYLSTIHACFNLGFEVSYGTHAGFVCSVDITNATGFGCGVLPVHYKQRGPPKFEFT